MADIPIAVLGTGMAGVGAGHAMQAHGARFVCYDNNPYRGGHTCSIRYNNGFVFDEGPHISFTKNERVRALLADAVQGRHEERKFAIDNYWQGQRIPHPVQCHLNELPVELTIKIIRDFTNPVLSVTANQQLHFECTWKNETDATIDFGESAVDDEMCIVVAGYYPRITDGPIGLGGNVFCLDGQVYY